jgi:hypothetical protein
MRNQKHTLVMHQSPDLEALFMGWLITSHECVSEALNVKERPHIKFIPAGPLRAEDWPGEETLDAKALEAKGYQFLDCGRGELDQHGRPENENRNSVSSLDLLVHAVNLDALLPYLMPIVAIISNNDLTGQDVAPNRSWKESETPHTPRQLRNVILGWNLLNKENPVRVFSLVTTAFGCIETNVGHRLTQVGDVSPTSIGNPDAAIDYREFFLADDIVNGASRYFATVYGIDVGEENEIVTEEFRKEVNDALVAQEREWETAVQDYWAATQGRDINVAIRTPAGVTNQRMSLAYGKSASTRFGAVTRLGNMGKRPPHEGKPRRPKADITIQFYGEGRFVIATKGLELDRVAAALREADLRKRGVNVTKEDRQMLDRPGHLRFADQAGRTRDALFFAEYRTSFGNGFRANPTAERTPLTIDEVVDITIKTLARAE